MKMRTKNYDLVKKAGVAGFASSEKEDCGGKTRKSTAIFQRPMSCHTENSEILHPQGTLQ